MELKFLKECNAENPCPMHFKMDSIKSNLKSVLSDTKIGDLLEEDKSEFIRSISTAIGIDPSLKISESQKVY
jgi:DNA-binding IscR family transcriptional regulator